MMKQIVRATTFTSLFTLLVLPAIALADHHMRPPHSFPHGGGYNHGESCSFSERYIGREDEGDSRTVRRSTGEFTLSATLVSSLYDVYERCETQYRSEQRCDGRGNCHYVSVPYPSYSQFRRTIESITSYVTLKFDHGAILIPSEEHEDISVSINAYQSNTPSITLDNTYYNYTLRDVRAVSHNSFEANVQTLKRKRVTPHLTVESLGVHWDGNKLIMQAKDVASSFLKTVDDPNAKVIYEIRVGRRKFIRYSVTLAEFEKEFSMKNFPDRLVFDAGEIPESSRKHVFQVTIKRVGSRFYNEEESTTLAVTFFLNGIGEVETSRDDEGESDSDSDRE
ncbi:MAG: hypothetical protein HQK50_00095 [Oligoflexia bacterium]|nr:hypothetical protein [Oligoflexia bacterium]MBF0363934.1 hypothetical protein [Oligoflexia bacterium]